MMNIIGSSEFNGTFSGSPVVGARHDFALLADLSILQNLNLSIETTGAHGNIFVRLENDENRYAEFNMGGDMTGDDNTRTQNLSKTIRSCGYTETGVDFDPQKVASVYVYFTDDGNVPGIADGTESSIVLSYDTEVEHSLVFVDGFSTELTKKVDLSSTTIQMTDRPVDPSTGEYINETLLVISDGTIKAIKDFAENPAEVGKILGEVFWVEFVSQNETTGVSTWNILQRGGGSVHIPPRIGDFRKSLRHTQHPQGSTVIIGLLKGLITEGVDQAKSYADQLQADYAQFTSDTNADLASWKITTRDELDANQDTFETSITTQQDEYEAELTSEFENFVANQRDITAKITEGETTKIDISSGNWLYGTTEVAYAGASALSITLDQTTFYEVDVTGTLQNNDTGFTSGRYPVAKIVANATQITSITNYGGAYDIAPPSDGTVGFELSEDLNAEAIVRIIDDGGTPKIAGLYDGQDYVFTGMYGILQESGVQGETKKVAPWYGVSKVHSGLTPGTQYYVQADGTIGITKTNFPLGIATGTTDLFLMHQDSTETSPGLKANSGYTTDMSPMITHGLGVTPKVIMLFRRGYNNDRESLVMWTASGGSHAVEGVDGLRDQAWHPVVSEVNDTTFQITATYALNATLWIAFG